MIPSPLFRLRSTIVAFGDSLTQLGWGDVDTIGWVSLLASAYTRRADVLNRGYSGYNTRHAIELLPRLVNELFPTSDTSVNDNTNEQREKSMSDSVLFCTVFFGANDAALPGVSPQHVPLEEYQHNLGQMVGKLQARGVCIIIFTPPPVDEVRWMAQWDQTESDRLNHVTRTYGVVCKEVAASYGCHVLDVFDLLGGNGCDYSQYLSDGLHLSSSGNVLLYQGLMQLIQEKYPNLAPMGGDGKNGNSGIAMEEPLWRDLCS